VAAKVYELPNGKRYELDLDNPEHAAWLEQAAKTEQAPNSVGRQLGLTARAAVKGVAAVPGVMADAVTGLYNTAANAVGADGFRFKETSGALDSALDSLGFPRPQDKIEQVVQAGTSAGFGAGGLAGVAKNAPAGLAALAQNPGAQALSATGGAAAAESAKQENAPVWGQMAAGIAGGIAPQMALGAGQLFGRGIHNLAEPWFEGGMEAIKARLLSDLAGGKKQALIQALRNTSDDMPGGYPTTGQRAATTGNAEIPALEKLLGSHDPTGFGEIGKQNEAARLALVQSVGKDKTALAQALAARRAQSDADYAGAFQQQIRADPTLAQLFQNPYVQKALPAALDLAKANKINPKDDLTQFLHYTKLGLDKLLSKETNTPLAGTEKREVLQAQKALMSWLGTKNPTYETARTNFETASRPITQMRVGQYLEDKLQAPLDTSQRAGVFAGAMRDAPSTIRQAGGGQAKELEQLLEAEQMLNLGSVYKNLQGQGIAESLARKGTTSAREKLGNAFEPIEPPGMLSRPIMIARAILERVQGKASEATLQSLTQDLKDPVKIAKLLENATPQEKIALMLSLKSFAGGQQQVIPNLEGQ